MTVAVAVLDPAPSYRQGLGAALACAGFRPEEPDDLAAWASGPGPRAVLVTVRPSPPSGPVPPLDLLPGPVVVVALLMDPTPDRFADVLRAGAQGAVAWDDAPERIAQALRSALDGDVLMPAGVAQAMAARAPVTPGDDAIGPGEAEWLRLLARGISIHDLAQKAGYSERAMFRVLHALYRRLQVANRTEAIVLASRRGLLD